MKIKKPSLKGIANTAYLGHFASDQHIQKGHNYSGKAYMSDPMSGVKSSELAAMNDSSSSSDDEFEEVVRRTRRRRSARRAMQKRAKVESEM
jgi:hypothetical protein